MSDEIGYILIVCETYLDAVDAFDVFCQYINDRDPWDIVQVFEHANCIQLNDDLRYIFTTRGYEKAYYHLKPDILTYEEWWDDLCEYDATHYFGGGHYGEAT